jgi:hypothetical protein
MTKSQIPNAKEIPKAKVKNPRMDTNEHECEALTAELGRRR